MLIMPVMHDPCYEKPQTIRVMLIWNMRKGLPILSVDICWTGWWVSSLHTRAGFIFMHQWALQLPDTKHTLKCTWGTHYFNLLFLCGTGECASPCLNGGRCVHPDSCNCTLYQAAGTHCQTGTDCTVGHPETCSLIPFWVLAW